MEIFENQKIKNMITVLLFVFAIFLIVFNFMTTPNVWVDEGVFTNVARSLAVNGSVGMQIAPGQSFPLGLLLSNGYPVIYPISWAFKFFGIGLWQARLVMVVYMFLLSVLFFIFSKKLYGFYPAVLTMLFLLSFSPFYGNGRAVQGEVPGLVFLLLGALFLLYWEKSDFKNKWFLFFSGLTLGLSASVKPLYLIVIFISVLTTFGFWFKNIKDKRVLLYFFLGALPSAMAWFLYQFNGEHSASGILKTYLSFAAYFAGNHSSNISVYQNIFHNFLRFFTESTPVLFLILLVLTSISFLFRYLQKVDKKISISEFFVFVFILVNWLGYLKGTGWYRYFFPANTLIYLFTPFAFIVVSNLFDKSIYKKIVLAVPIVLLVFQFYHLIFLSATSFVIRRTRNQDLELALSKIDSSKKVFFYNTVEAIVFLKSNNYYQYLSMEGFLEVGDKNLINDNTFDYILVNDSDDIKQLSKCYDGEKLSRYVLLSRNKSCKK